jgi:hypothetical protein
MILTFLLLLIAALSSFVQAGVVVGKRADVELPRPFSVGDEKRKVENRYLVSLFDGHTLEQHWGSIGVDLSKDGKEFNYLEAINTYGVTVEDEKIIKEKVLNDPGVEIVESM